MKGFPFRQTAIAAVVTMGAAVLAVPTTAYSAELGSWAGNGLSVSLNYDHSVRKLKQSGSGTVMGFSTTESGPGWTYTESLTESVRGLNAKQEQDQLFAKMSMAVTPRIDVYGKLGGVKTRMKSLKGGTVGFTYSEKLTEEIGGTYQWSESGGFTPPNSFFKSGRTSWGLVAGLGANVKIHEWERAGVGLSMDLMYEYQRARANWTVWNLWGDESVKVKRRTSHEWAARLVLEKYVGNFRPYGGISYSRMKGTFKTERVSEFSELDGFSGKVRMQNKRPVGVFAGMEYRFAPNMSLLAELRGVDATGANIGFRYSF